MRKVVEILDIVDIIYIGDIIVSHGDYEKSDKALGFTIGTFHKDQNVLSMI